jgi:hypothetical protein
VGASVAGVGECCFENQFVTRDYALRAGASRPSFREDAPMSRRAWRALPIGGNNPDFVR